ncbi:MAG: helicase-related protein [Spirochaetia bacterium]|nr:helicase-related protein [Spirochaetia bacterium]
MDFSRFSVAPALMEGAAATDSYRSVFYERLLNELFDKQENLFIKTDIVRDRASIITFPLLHWSFSRLGKPEAVGAASKALYLSAEDAIARTCYEAALAMLGSAKDGPRLCFLGSTASAASEDGTEDMNGVPEAAKLYSEGDIESADCVFASFEAFSGNLDDLALVPRSFGFIIIDQAELIAEMPGENLRRVQGRFLPSWERRSVVITNKHSPRAKNFAWDFADNPKEIKLAEALGFGGSIASKSLEVKEADKIRFILSLQQSGEEGPLCVFCNLKSTAAELAARLAMNSVPADYIGGNLNLDRKRQIVDKALSWKGSFVLILTDEGSKGAEKPGFSRVVNYDMPLEPELYFDRLAFLDREKESALLYNLVCERYVYGVPAIERMIQKPLAPQPLDQNLVLPEDLSAGKEIPMPERRFNRRDERHGRDGRAGRSERTDRGYRRDDRPEAGRDDRRDGRRDDRRNDTQGVDPRVRREDRPSPEPRNPYAMSMEERLALYKKRYGKAVQSGSSGSDGKPGSNKETPAARKTDPRARPTTDPKPKAAADPKSKAAADPKPRASADSPAEAPPKEREGSVQNTGGIFSRLQNLFGTRKE